MTSSDGKHRRGGRGVAIPCAVLAATVLAVVLIAMVVSPASGAKEDPSGLGFENYLEYDQIKVDDPEQDDDWKWEYDGNSKGIKNLKWGDDTPEQYKSIEMELLFHKVNDSGEVETFTYAEARTVGKWVAVANSVQYKDVTLKEFEIVKAIPEADQIGMEGEDENGNVTRTYNAQDQKVTLKWLVGEGEDDPDRLKVRYFQIAEGSETELTTSLPRNVGTYKIKADVEEGENFSAASDLEIGYLYITKADLVLDTSSVLTQSWDYDGSTKTVKVKIEACEKEKSAVITVTLTPETYNGHQSPVIGSQTATSGGSSFTFEEGFTDVVESGWWSWKATADCGQYDNYNELGSTESQWIKVEIEPRELDAQDLDVQWHPGYTQDQQGNIRYTYDGYPKQPTVKWKSTGTSSPSGQIKVMYIKDGIESYDPPMDAGTYTVYAVFDQNDPNYDISDPESARIQLGTIVIDPRDLDVDRDLDIQWEADGGSDGSHTYEDDGTGKGPDVSWVQPLRGPFDVVYIDEDGNPTDGRPTEPGTYQIYIRIGEDNGNFNPVDAPSEKGFVGTMTIEGDDGDDGSIGDIIVELDEDGDGERDEDDRTYHGNWSEDGTDDDPDDSGTGTREDPKVHIKGYEAGDDEKVPKSDKTVIVKTDVDPEDIPYWVIPTVWIDVPTGKKPVVKLYDEDDRRVETPEILSYTSDSVTFITYQVDHAYLKAAITFVPTFIPIVDGNGTDVDGYGPDSEVPGAIGSMVFDEKGDGISIVKKIATVISGVVVAILAILIVATREKGKA